MRIATIGSVNLEIWYSCEDEMLLVRLHRIDILAKPSPSVINSWDYTPEVRVSILQEKRKFWDSRASKGRWTLTPHQATYIPIKKSVVQDQCLRLTCFDGERKNDLIPIGHVFVQLKDLDLSWKSSCYVREIEVNSVVYLFHLIFRYYKIIICHSSFAFRHPQIVHHHVITVSLNFSL